MASDTKGVGTWKLRHSQHYRIIRVPLQFKSTKGWSCCSFLSICLTTLFPYTFPAFKSEFQAAISPSHFPCILFFNARFCITCTKLGSCLNHAPNVANQYFNLFSTEANKQQHSIFWKYFMVKNTNRHSIRLCLPYFVEK